MIKKRLTKVEQLEHRLRFLESLVKKHKLKPITIENVIDCFSQTHGQKRWAGRIVDAPLVVHVAKVHYGLTFKPTSVSAVLCKLTRMGLVKKYSVTTQTFHSYIVK
jgi:hypothetical protein